MPQNDFYADSLHTAFPFTGAKAEPYLPKLLADIRVFIDLSLNYDHREHAVACERISAASANQAAQLDQPGMVAFAVFELQHLTTAAEYLVAPFFGQRYKRNELLALSLSELDKLLSDAAESYQLSTDPRVSGWIVEGDDVLQYSQPLPLPVRIEPSRIIITGEVPSDYGDTTVINEYGPPSEPPSACSHLIEEVAEDPSPALDESCSVITGPVTLYGAYQSRLVQDSLQNSITVEADPGTGESLRNCQEITQYHRESPFSFRCDEVLRRINGQPGESMSFPSGSGVSVESHPELHRVVIRIGSPDFEVCVTEDDANQAPEYLPTSSDGLNCGQEGAAYPRPVISDDDTGFFKIENRPEINVISGGTTTTPTRVFCDWTWNTTEGQWDFISGRCPSPQGCLPPDQPPGPELNKNTKTICTRFTTSLDSPILNGDFEDEALFNHWDTFGDVTLITDPGDFDLADLPLVRLGPGARIEQRFVKRNPVPYIIQFASQASVLGTTVSLIEETTDRLLHQFTVPATPIGDDHFGPFSISASSFRVVVENISTQVAYFGFVSLVRQ